MRKFKMKTFYRISGIMLCAVVLGLSVYSLIMQITGESTVIVEEKLFEGTIVPEASYIVLLKENNYFSKEQLEPGGVYIRGLIKNVQVSLGAAYSGTAPAALSGEYKIYGRVTGYQGDEEKREIIWSKDYLFKSEYISETERIFNITDTIEVELAEYDTLVSAISNEFGVNLTYDLTIYLEGAVKAESDEGSIELPITASVHFPLKSSLFSIQENCSNIVTDSVINKVETVDENAVNYIPLCIIGIVMAVLGLVSLILFVRKASPDETKKEHCIKCLRNCRSRMVRLAYLPTMERMVYYQIELLSDMIKLSDEMRQPIFYIGDEEQAIAEGRLYIIHQNDIYQHKLQ